MPGTDFMGVGFSKAGCREPGSKAIEGSLAWNPWINAAMSPPTTSRAVKECRLI